MSGGSTLDFRTRGFSSPAPLVHCAARHPARQPLCCECDGPPREAAAPSTAPVHATARPRLCIPRTVASRRLPMSGAMRMQPAAPALRTINSETNMAVQLLAALRASPAPAFVAPPPCTDRQSVTDDDDDRTAVASDTSGSTVGSPLLARAAAASATTTQSGGERSSPANSGSSTETTLYKYSRAERQEALRRFKEKKRLRTFKKTIRYDVRKRLADTRPRYKGRFSKPPPGEHYDDGTPAPLA